MTPLLRFARRIGDRLSPRIRNLLIMFFLTTVLVVGILSISDWSLTEASADLLMALIWPIALGTIILVFRAEVADLLAAVVRRVQQGSGIEIGWFKLTSTIPVPSASEKVTLTNVALLHTSFVSEKGTRRISDGMIYYQFEVIVVAPKEVLDRVKEVRYELPEPWPEKYRFRTTRDRESCFKMKDLANGTTIVVAEVRFHDQQESVYLNRFIDLRPARPHI